MPLLIDTAQYNLIVKISFGEDPVAEAPPKVSVFRRVVKYVVRLVHGN